MKTSAKELLEQLESEVEDLLIDDQIIRIDYVSSDDQIDTDGNKDFPRIYYKWMDDGNLDENNNTMTVGFLFCDVSTGKNGVKKRDYEIKSDMVQAASKLFDNLSREDYFADANPSLIYTPFSNRFNNGMSGIELTVQFVLSKPCFDV